MNEIEFLEQFDKIQNIINTIVSKGIDDYMNEKSEMPFIINVPIPYQQIKEIHFDITLLCIYSKFILEPKQKKRVQELFEKKLLIDSLLKCHKEYSKAKYPKEFEEKLINQKGEKFIKLNKNLLNKRFKFIKSFLHLLVHQKMIQNTSSNRVGIASLFIPIKGKEKIQWEGSVYSIKLIFDLLKKNKLISKPQYFNEFIVLKFQILDKSNGFIDFKVGSFKNSKINSGYDSLYPKWSERINELTESFQLPIISDFK